MGQIGNDFFYFFQKNSLLEGGSHPQSDGPAAFLKPAQNLPLLAWSLSWSFSVALHKVSANVLKMMPAISVARLARASAAMGFTSLGPQASATPPFNPQTNKQGRMFPLVPKLASDLMLILFGERALFC